MQEQLEEQLTDLQKNLNQSNKSERNITFTGTVSKWDNDKQEVVKINRQAPEFIINGNEKIEMPEHAENKKDFQLEPENLSIVLNLFPHDWKAVKRLS